MYCWQSRVVPGPGSFPVIVEADNSGMSVGTRSMCLVDLRELKLPQILLGGDAAARHLNRQKGGSEGSWRSMFTGVLLVT